MIGEVYGHWKRDSEMEMKIVEDWRILSLDEDFQIVRDQINRFPDCR